MLKKTVILCILDGIAYSKHPKGDAYYQAYTPNLDKLHKSSLNCSLIAHGTAVGLPSDDDMGNSEVGHNAIGGGRIVSQGAKLVEEAINNKSIFKNIIWQELIDNALENNSTLHFLGLLSDGNVHSHIRHLFSMLEKADSQGIKKIRIHTLLDGRDVGQYSALDYILPLEEKLNKYNNNGCDYAIASGGGRMLLTMDRYNAEWSMVELGWKTHVQGIGRNFSSAQKAIETYRQELNCSDQYLPAFVISNDKQEAIGKIQDNDSVIFFNFRGDRSIEISKTFDDDEFEHFDRGQRPKVIYAGMMQYDGDENIPKKFLVSPPKIDNPVGKIIAENGKAQFAISETQKYGHITYFYNGNKSTKFDNNLEDYLEIPSFPPPFDNHPWMKASEITDAVIKAIDSNKYDFIRINYPNGDMIGHTGNFNACRMTVEAADFQLGRLIKKAQKIGAILLVTADHGNCDEMYEIKKGEFVLDEKGNKKIKTSHSLNPVPFIIFDPNYDGSYKISDATDLSIGNIGSTCLDFLEIKKPNFYLDSIIKRKQ